VLHEGSHAVVGAVAGSGKTFTMVARCVHLIKVKGVDPRRLLILMFNASAQQEFLHRLKKACAEEGIAVPEVLTFHAFGRRLADRLCDAGLLDGARLETSMGVMRSLARDVLQQVNEQESEEDRLDITYERINEFLSAIDALKSDLYPCDDGRGDTTALAMDQRYVYGFKLFEAARKRANLRFFSDLIYDPVMAALENPKLARYVADRYEEIVVDEFQDINEGQITLLRMIAGNRAKVMAVGDEDQTIYAWRGAKPDYMTSLFETEFPGAVRYTLPHTFRYGHSLSLLANFVITTNTNRTDKICLSGKEVDTHIDVRVPTQSSHGQEVVTVLREWEAQGRSRKDAVVLFREYAHTPSTEVALLQAGIPYRIVGAAPFFERAEALGMRAYLQLAAGGFEEIDDYDRRLQLITALLQTPTLYLRKPVLARLAEQIAAEPQNILQLAEETFERDRLCQPYTRTRRLDAIDRWRWVLGFGVKKLASILLTDVISRIGLYKEIEKNVPDRRAATEKIQMISQIVQLAKVKQQSPEQFAHFLDQLAADYSSAASTEDDRVLLTSVHRSKGLEWKLVILPELTDGQFPALREDTTPEEIEDERRLFYVATTRAIEWLVLVAPLDRSFVAAAHKGMSAAPAAPIASRFLYEANVLVASEGVSSTRKFSPDERTAALLQRYRNAQAAAPSTV